MSRNLPVIANNGTNSSNVLTKPGLVLGDFLEDAGFTADSLAGVDLTFDGSEMYLESGDGTGALAFEGDAPGDGYEPAIFPAIFKDVLFDADGGYDGIFYDGSLLWSIDGWAAQRRGAVPSWMFANRWFRTGVST